MNNARRKEIASEERDVAKALAFLEDVLPNLESLRDEEQEYYDNMPENLQNGELGERSQEAIGQLDEAIEAVSTFIDADVTGILENAQA